MNELKKCAFCGGRAGYEGRAQGWIVRCDNRFLPNDSGKLCPVNARTRDGLTKDEATAAWNTRQPSWVRTADALPDESSEFLVAYRWDASAGWSIKSADFFAENEDPAGWVIDGISGEPIVIAWMPLPEPTTVDTTAANQNNEERLGTVE